MNKWYSKCNDATCNKVKQTFIEINTWGNFSNAAYSKDYFNISRAITECVI